MSRDAPSTARYFDACAGLWRRYYAPTGEMRERVDWFVKALQARAPAARRLLDFGCGTGEIARALAAQGYEATGSDISPAMIEMARAQPAEGKVAFVTLDAARSPRLPFEDGAFDAALSSSVFEYLADPEAQARELRRVLAPRGCLLLTVPDPRHPLRAEEAKALAAFETAWWRPLFDLAPLVWRGRTRLEYLRRSRNRPGLEGWGALLSRAGFDVEAPEACTGPLAMLAARARS
jgi:SAM-dependent methyltransferase